MRKLKLILLTILINLAFIFMATPLAIAWYSYGKPGDMDIHGALALLSLDKVNGLIRFRDININEKANALDIGANAPDRNKNWIDHEATYRVRDTLCASLKASNSKEALMRLAIGFHYLADNGDATAGRYKEQLMKIVYKMLLDKNNTYIDPKERIIWGFRNSPQWKELTTYFDQNMKVIKNVDNLVRNLRKMAVDQNKKLDSAYYNAIYQDNRYSQQNFYRLKYELMVTFAYIRACQNRLVDFYVEELAKGDKGECKPPQPIDNRSVNCSTTTKSGTDAPATIIVKVGWNPGIAIFSYEMYTVKDRMIVVYGGQTLLDTGCVSGNRRVNLYLSGKSDKVTVYVKPACEKSGTQWNFTLECPK